MPDAESGSKRKEDAAQFNNIPGVQLGDLVRAGARFEPRQGMWVFADGSRGRFLDRVIEGKHVLVFVNMPR